jgi:hypothetical protein
MPYDFMRRSARLSRRRDIVRLIKVTLAGVLVRLGVAGYGFDDASLSKASQGPEIGVLALGSTMRAAVAAKLAARGVTPKHVLWSYAPMSP